MEINRDNYEEFFLMYVDNELTDPEKVAVLMFLKQNKDLEEEFRRIHYTVSKPDEAVELPDKSFLFRSDTAPFISKVNYEEVFVLYHDRELSEAEIQATDNFLAEHGELKDEFRLIGVATLTPDSAIVFPGKKALYRREKRGRVVPVIFWRMLAAAVFIGFGLWISVLIFRQPKQIVRLQATTGGPKNSSSTVGKSAVSQRSGTQPVAATSVPDPKNASPVAAAKKTAGKIASFPRIIKGREPSRKRDVATNKVTEENMTLEAVSKEQHEIAAPEKSEIKSRTAGEANSLTAINPAKPLTRPVEVTNEELPARDADAKTASYVETNDNQNYVFYNVTTTDFRKTKVGGLFKKIKRVIARTNPIGRLIAGTDRQLATKS